VNASDQLEVIPGAQMALQAGPGITIGSAGLLTEIRVDTGEGIIVSANGVRINTDDTSVTINAQDQLAVIPQPPHVIQEGPGIQVDTVGDLTVVAVDTGEGIVVGPNGIRVNTDETTVRINAATDQLEVIAPPVDIQEGPGISVDKAGTLNVIGVDTGPGIIVNASNELMVNTDNTTIQVNAATDQLEVLSVPDIPLVAGPGISIWEDATQKNISVDTGAAIVHSADGIAVNVDGTTIGIVNDALEVIGANATPEVYIQDAEPLLVGLDSLWADLSQLGPVTAAVVVNLDDLQDVSTAGVVAGQTLVYDTTTRAGTGSWVPGDVGAGPEGPTGPTGPTGISSVIIGDFGAVQTPAGLPPDGLIPVDWDGPGVPAVAYQVEVGQSLYYDKPADPLDGHLFQYVGTTVDSDGWLDIGLIQGPPGPPGPGYDEVWLGSDEPTDPVVELWYDPDAPSSGGGGGPIALDDLTDVDVSTVPPVTGQALGFDGTQWEPTSLAYLPSTGGTVSGQITIQRDSGQTAIDFGAPGYPPMLFKRNGDEMWLVEQDGRGVGLKIHPYFATFQKDLTVGINLMVGGTITDGSGPVMNNTDRESLRAEIQELRAEVETLKGRIA
jgi:hypothetical protein